MNTLEAIGARRSIRKFKAQPLSRELIETILETTIQAPSAKNVQPWRFVVVQGPKHDELVRIMQGKADKLKGMGEEIGSLEWTARAMAPAPATILVLNAAPPSSVPLEHYGDYDFVMLQSIGAAIQTMLLSAQELGLGSLWVCDVLYAKEEIMAWLGREDDRLVAAVTLGYADESPGARPRRPWTEVTEWIGVD